MGTLRRTCATVPQPSELQFGVVHAVGRGIAVLDGGPRRARGRGRFGVFVPHFYNGKCHWVADGEMFPIRMQKLDNISVRQTYRWKAWFVGFWRYIQFEDQSRGLWEISKKVTIVLRKLTLQHLQRRLFLELDCAWPWPWLCAGLGHNVGRSCCGVINSPVTTFAVVIKPPVGDFRSDAALFPNHFGQTCYTLLQFCSKLKLAI